MDDEQTGSDHFLEASRFWVQRVFVPLLVLLGVAGNLVTVVVLTRKGMRCSTNVYLTALAVVDVVYLLFVLILSFEHYPRIHELRFELYWRFYGINRWLVDAASSTSVWLTVSFTVERYIAVCHPMRGKVLCTERRAKRVIAVVAVLCLAATSSTSFEYQLTVSEAPRTADDVDGGRNDTVLHIRTEPTRLGTNVTYTTLFYWFTSVTFTFVPLALLATLNCFLVNAVRRSRRHRRRLTKSREAPGAPSQQNRVTVVLIAVVILFLVCQTPTACLLIYTSVYPDEWRRQNALLRGLGNLFNLLVSINASCNFLLYCALSDKYRRTFRTLFCSGCGGGGGSATALTMSRPSSVVRRVPKNSPSPSAAAAAAAPPASR